MNANVIKSKILTGGLWAFWGRVGSTVLVVTVNGLISRLLSHDEMGAYFLCLSFVAMLSIIIQVGLNHGMVKLLATEIALNNNHKVRGHIVTSLRIVFFLSTLIIIIFSNDIVKEKFANLFKSTLLTKELGWIAFWSSLYSIQIILTEVWKGFQKIDHAIIFGGLANQIIALISIGLLFLVHINADLHSVVWISVFSLMVSNIFSFLLLIPYVFGNKTSEKIPLAHNTSIKDILYFSWPFLFASLTMFTLSQADLWLVGYYGSEHEVAFYGAASKLALLTTMPLNMVNFVIPPFLAERYAVGDHNSLESILRRSSLVAFIPALILFLLYCFAGSDLLQLVFGMGYDQAYPFLVILSSGYVLHIFAGSPDYTLMMTGHQTAMMVITAVAAIIMFSIGILAGWFYGSVGIAWSSFVGMVVQTLSMWIYTRIRLGVWTHPEFAKIWSFRKLLTPIKD